MCALAKTFVYAFNGNNRAFDLRKVFVCDTQCEHRTALLFEEKKQIIGQQGGNFMSARSLVRYISLVQAGFRFPTMRLRRERRQTCAEKQNRHWFGNRLRVIEDKLAALK
jgi:hypothetical protein